MRLGARRGGGRHKRDSMELKCESVCDRKEFTGWREIVVILVEQQNTETSQNTINIFLHACLRIKSRLASKLNAYFSTA